MSELNPRSLDLLELTFEERRKLKERIDRNKGLIRIFVHPMYEKWRGNEKYYLADPHCRRLVEIEVGLGKLLSLPEENTPPILIMEEVMFVQSLQNWFENNPHGTPRSDVYFVKTLQNDPTPPTGLNRPDAWRMFREFLRGLGVQKILIAGCRLEVSHCKQDWTLKGPWISSCVGIAASYLWNKKGGEFEMGFSALIDPKGSRRYLLTYQP